jgi:hypothetical protein
MALGITMVALTISAVPAQAASTRADYVAQADPICHAANLKSKRVMRKHHLSSLIELDDLKSGDREDQLIVARQLSLTAKLIPPFIAALSPIPAPPGDEATIAKWIGDYRTFGRKSSRGANAIRHSKPHRAYHLVLSAVGPIFKDISALEPWGFQYCI